MYLLQFLLRRHGHSAHSLVSVLLVEEAAVADHQCCDTLVGAVEQGLQSAARHTCHADVLRVHLLVEGRLLVRILGDNPVDALYLLLRA